MKIIRAFELRGGNLFIKQGTLYLVLRVTNSEIIYAGYNELLETYWGRQSSMGSKSQERVQYYGVKPENKVTKPISKGGYDPTRKLRPLHKTRVSRDIAAEYSNYYGTTYRNLK